MTVNKTINLIKINQIYKKKIIETTLNKYELNLIKSLIRINLIKYVKKKNNKYYLYLNYFNNKLIFQNIINLYKPSKPIFITYNTLKYITNKYKVIFILNTNKGVLTNYEALQLKIGGVLIIKLWN